MRRRVLGEHAAELRRDRRDLVGGVREPQHRELVGDERLVGVKAPIDCGSGKVRGRELFDQVLDLLVAVVPGVRRTAASKEAVAVGVVDRDVGVGG